MRTGFALDYIPHRMRELGYGEDYTMRFRHLVMQPNEVRRLKGFKHLYLLVEPNDAVKVESEFGLYDIEETATNELQYEHFGKITVTNKYAEIQHLQFIQVITKTMKHAAKQ